MHTQVCVSLHVCIRPGIRLSSESRSKKKNFRTPATQWGWGGGQGFPLCQTKKVLAESGIPGLSCRVPANRPTG